MNFNIEKSFVIPEIWIKIFSFCSCCEVFNTLKFIYLYQEKSKVNYNINILVKAYVLNKINSNKLDTTIYKIFKDIQYSYNNRAIKYYMKYYTNIYTYSQQRCSSKYEHTYILKAKLDKILYHDTKNYSTKKSKYNVFNIILAYLNKKYEILYKNTGYQYQLQTVNDQSTDFKTSPMCYKNNCGNNKLCKSCIELNYWNKLLNVIDTP